MGVHLLVDSKDGHNGIQCENDCLPWDCFFRHARARFRPNKLPATAVQSDYRHDVIPIFEAHEPTIEVVLSGNGHAFYSGPDQPPYTLFLHLEEVDHRTTRKKPSELNSIVERFNRTLMEEHFRGR